MHKLLSSKYTKAALTMLFAGAILLLFADWVSKSQVSNGLDTVNSTLMPIYIGVFIAFITCPIYNKLVARFYHVSVDHAKIKTKRRALGFARVLASVIVVIIIIGTVALFGYFVLPALIDSIMKLIETMPSNLESFSNWSKEHLSAFPGLVKVINNIANSGSAEAIKWVQERILQNGDNGLSIASMLSQGVLSVVNVVIDMTVGLLIAIYLLNYKERLFAICRKMTAATLSPEKAEAASEFANTINTTFIGFIVGRILDAIVVGLLTYAVLAIFHINNALLISIIVGVTNVIPFFGPFLGAIPSVFLLLIQDPMEAFWFIIIILIIQQIDGNIIGPKIVGEVIGLPSFWVLIAVLIGGGLFGFIGMFFGVPAFAVIYKYVNRGMERRLEKKNSPSATMDYFNLDSYGIDDSDFFIDESETADDKQKA